jgi:hypothetical protein
MSEFDATPGQIVVHRPANVLASAEIMGEQQFDRVWRMAKALAGSGMFKDVTQAEQAFGRILLGADLGLTPTQALMSIDVVEGNVQVRAVRLAAWLRQHPDYDYAVAEHDEQHCVIDFYYKGEAAGTSSFSMEDAAKARLIKDHPKSPWKAHPRNMLFARAMSNGVRWFCPDLTGGIPVYTEADSFESTAVEVGSGDGDGSEPGWDVEPEFFPVIEGILARAEAVGLGALADRASVQLRLNGQPAASVSAWVEMAEGQLAAVEPQEAEVVDGEAS